MSMGSVTSERATYPDLYEPDEQWKAELKEKLCVVCNDMLLQAKQKLEHGLASFGADNIDPVQRKKLIDEYQASERQIKSFANQSFRVEVEKEREQRRWAAGLEIRTEWRSDLESEPMAIMSGIRRQRIGSAGEDNANPTGESTEPDRSPGSRQQTTTTTSVPTPGSVAPHPSTLSTPIPISTAQRRSSTPETPVNSMTKNPEVLVPPKSASDNKPLILGRRTSQASLRTSPSQPSTPIPEAQKPFSNADSSSSLSYVSKAYVERDMPPSHSPRSVSVNQDGEQVDNRSAEPYHSPGLQRPNSTATPMSAATRPSPIPMGLTGQRWSSASGSHVDPGPKKFELYPRIPPKPVAEDRSKAILRRPSQASIPASPPQTSRLSSQILDTQIPLSNADRKSSSSYVSKAYAPLPEIPKDATTEHDLSESRTSSPQGSRPSGSTVENWEHSDRDSHSSPSYTFRPSASTQENKNHSVHWHDSVEGQTPGTRPAMSINDHPNAEREKMEADQLWASHTRAKLRKEKEVERDQPPSPPTPLYPEKPINNPSLPRILTMSCPSSITSLPQASLSSFLYRNLHSPDSDQLAWTQWVDEKHYAERSDDGSKSFSDDDDSTETQRRAEDARGIEEAAEGEAEEARIIATETEQEPAILRASEEALTQREQCLERREGEVVQDAGLKRKDIKLKGKEKRPIEDETENLRRRQEEYSRAQQEHLEQRLSLYSWTQINLDDEGIDVRTQIQSLLRDVVHLWRTVDFLSPSAEAVVMDVLQQELDDASCLNEYRTACMKCLRTLSKARSIVPSSFSCRDVTREGKNSVWGGGFSDIWKGRLHNTQVCLKVLRIFISGEERAKIIRNFCQEALIWRQLRHPNVLPFLGVSEDLFAPSYCLISPWMVNGNTMSYIEAHPDHNRLTSVVQVADAMEYLHNLDPPIIHADIRGANILVTDDQRCCLADFGLSLIAESQNFNTTSGMRKGSLRWLAPEYILPETLDQTFIAARDSYAYGCTVIEVFTGKPPFSDIRNDRIFMTEVIARRSRPPLKLPSDVFPHDGLGSLVAECLRTSPGERPDARRISRRVRSAGNSPTPIPIPMAILIPSKT